MGRWQVLQRNPITVCDTGHNMGGWQYLGHQLKKATKKYKQVHIVFGMANDKDVQHVLACLPSSAKCYWTKASVHRAMDVNEIASLAKQKGLEGEVFENVASAYDAAMNNAKENDFVYIGGSSFVVADLLNYLHKEQKR